MYLLNQKNGEKVFRNFNGEETLVSGYQGKYQYLKVIKGKVADNLNKSLDEMNNIWKTWTKIRDKYRKKDKKEKF